MSEPGDGPRRRLLVGGENLRTEVSAPPRSGGDKYDPLTPEEAREVLLPQIRSAAAAASQLPEQLRVPGRVYVEAKMLPNYLAASYFPGDLLTEIGAVAVGTRTDVGTYTTRTRRQREATRRLILAVGDEGLARWADLVASGGVNRSQRQAFTEIQRIEEVAMPTSARILRPTGHHRGDQREALPTWEAVLNPAGITAGQTLPLEEDNLERWIELVESVGGVAHRSYARRVGGLTFMPVAAEEDQAVQLARFNPLRVLRPMPAIRPRPRFGPRSVTRLQPPSISQPIDTSVRVAVFDGGLDTSRLNPALFPAVHAVDLTPEPPEQEDLDHGTGVTAAVNYGLLAPGARLSRPPLPCDTFRVLPAPYDPGDLEGYWVLDQIKQIVEAGEHKIVNLSLGPELAVEDDTEPNRWTSELDQLAWEKDVLFVVAAGNFGDEDPATGLHRVQVPADMANGLSVGATDLAHPGTPWSRAPYSSQGPGRPGARVQPAGVQFGGVDGRLFNVARADGTFLEASGTSFSAPVTTHALADLTTRLPRVNASILRAFAAHFAQRHRNHKKLLHEVGYGRHPLSFATALDCTPDDVHVLFVDEIARSELIGYQLPVPGTTTSAKLKMRLTLAYASPVEPSQPGEYTNASVELALRPHQFIHRMTAPKDGNTRPRARDVDIRSDEFSKLLDEGWQFSQEPVTRTLTGPRRLPEWEQQESGKWETLRHYELTFAAADLELPRLELSFIARRGGAIDRSPTQVPFAILVSLEDTSRSGMLYDETVREFAALRPAQPVRAQVRVRGTRTREPIWR